MLEQLKKEVCDANKLLPKLDLVKFTWGNVSAFDRESGYVVIKPSGVEYDKLTADNMVVVDLSGKIIDGTCNPSSDTPTHLELYKSFPEIGGIVHTHSCFATAFAQARHKIPILGTTHADCFRGDIPCTRIMKDSELLNEYEKNTGVVIAETFQGIDPNEIPAVLVANHGPFAWGKNTKSAVENIAVLEEIAKMAYLSLSLNSEIQNISDTIRDVHFLRKHGKNAYYGQKQN